MTPLQIAQLVIICLYVAMLATGIWLVRLVRQLIAIIRRVDARLIATAPPASVPEAPGALEARR